MHKGKSRIKTPSHSPVCLLLQAWGDYGIALSTASNEASKMFDATLTQVSWYSTARLTPRVL